MIGTLRDITARKETQSALEEMNTSLNRRIAELSSLNNIAQMITTAADQRGVLENVAEELCRLFNATGAEISLFGQDGSALTPVAHYSPVPAHTATGAPTDEARFDQDAYSLLADSVSDEAAPTEPSFLQTLQDGNPLVIYNAQQKAEVVGSINIVRALQFQGLMVVPLAARSNVLGLVTVGSKREDRVYTTDELELLQTSAGQIAGVVEILRLLDEERMLRQMAEYHERELTNLLQIAEQLTSTLDLNSLLESLLIQIEAVVPCTVSTIMSVEEDELTVLAYHGPMPKLVALHQKFPRDKCDFLFANDGAPFIAATDVAQEPSLHANLRNLFGKQMSRFLGRSRSWASIPLYGNTGRKSVIVLGHRTPNRFAETDWQFVTAVAGHAAVAIENAQLYRQARTHAAYKERNRLARELHDAVTQTLFAASLIADTLLDSWDRSPEITRQGLGELQQLTRGALVEMRTLLLELSPETLMKKHLSELLQSLTDAFTSRTKIAVELCVTGISLLPPNVQIAFYRITQEALNNVFKHAEAHCVRIRVTGEATTVTLLIADDGRGFNVEEVRIDRMGLAIIRERADAIGAHFQIQSADGVGTTLTIIWSGPQP